MVKASARSTKVRAHRKQGSRLWELAIVAFALLAYWPALQAGWVWDDDAHILKNATLRSPSALGLIWSDPSRSPQYYPLVFTTFWIEERLFGLDPRPFHLGNILLHAGAAILLLRVLRRLAIPGALAIALLFLLHPVQVESVAWITERKNVLSGLLYFGSALAYFRFDPPERHRGAMTRATSQSYRSYALALLLFVLALCAKTVVATLPAALLLIYYYKRPRIERQTLVPLIPFFVLGIGFGLHTAWLERTKVGALGDEWALSMLERCVVAGRAFWFYPLKVLAPFDLTFIYPRWTVTSTPWSFWPFVLAGGGLITLYVLRARIGKGPLVAALFYAGTILPALGFLNVYWMRFSFVADHFQYLALLGPITLVVAAWMRFRPQARWDRPVAAVVLVLCAVLTFRQATFYRSAETLWRKSISDNPRAWIAHNNLGQILLTDGRGEEAVTHFRQAIALNPKLAEAHNNLATFFAQQGKFEDAAKACDAAIAADPMFSQAYFNRALAGLNLGQFEGVLNDLATFEKQVGPYARTSFYRGLALGSLGRLDEAVAAFNASLSLDPNQPDVHAARERITTIRASMTQ